MSLPEAHDTGQFDLFGTVPGPSYHRSAIQGQAIPSRQTAPHPAYRPCRILRSDQISARPDAGLPSDCRSCSPCPGEGRRVLQRSAPAPGTCRASTCSTPKRLPISARSSAIRNLFSAGVNSGRWAVINAQFQRSTLPSVGRAGTVPADSRAWAAGAAVTLPAAPVRPSPGNGGDPTAQRDGRTSLDPYWCPPFKTLAGRQRISCMPGRHRTVPPAVLSKTYLPYLEVSCP